MKYDHVVKHNGIWYEAWEEIPMNELITENSTEEKDMEFPFSDVEIEMETQSTMHMYTNKELEQMTAKQMRKIAEDKGFRLMKSTKDDLINEFLSKQ